MGVIAHHDDYPIERLAINPSMSLLGSASHDECVKLTDIRDLFGEDDDDEAGTEGELEAKETKTADAPKAVSTVPWEIEERFDWSEDMETDDPSDEDEDMDGSGSEDEESTEGEEATPPPPVVKGREARRERLRPGEGKSRDEAEDKERSSFFGGL